jgi:hypothetical protein
MISLSDHSCIPNPTGVLLGPHDIGEFLDDRFLLVDHFHVVDLHRPLDRFEEKHRPVIRITEIGGGPGVFGVLKFLVPSSTLLVEYWMVD